MTHSFEKEYDAQTKLIYSIIVAGKSANFADRVTRRFLEAVGDRSGLGWKNRLPFKSMLTLNEFYIRQCATDAGTGNYGKLSKACFQIACRIYFNPVPIKPLDLFTCAPADLEEIHGIGKKTSRFFIMWIRPEEQYAALDVHVLRWMKSLGHDVPRSTPGNAKQYELIEKAFIAEAHKRGKTARQLDMEIWEAGAGRTQRTALPDIR